MILLQTRIKDPFCRNGYRSSGIGISYRGNIIGHVCPTAYILASFVYYKRTTTKHKLVI